MVQMPFILCCGNCILFDTINNRDMVNLCSILFAKIPKIAVSFFIILKFNILFFSRRPKMYLPLYLLIDFIFS